MRESGSNSFRLPLLLTTVKLQLPRQRSLDLLLRGELLLHSGEVRSLSESCWPNSVVEPSEQREAG